MHKTSGRGLIFDFDDTLVETTVFFEISREKFARYMEELGFPLKDVLETLDRRDIENVKKCQGFMKECFPLAMVQTYRHFCSLENRDQDPAICKIVENIGWWVFDQKPVPVPGAIEVLDKLAGEYDLFLATKGDPSVQWQRIDESGLKKYFKNTYVLKDKNWLEYIKIANINGIDPGKSWVIGNSIKSEINPGIRAGFNCIYIPNSYTWHFEMEEPVGSYVTLKSVSMIPDLLVKKNIAV
ncbi:MAG: HAD hydrolase-like protein [Bacillota bacterium]